MTKSELIAQLAARHSQFSVADIEMAVKTILDALVKKNSPPTPQRPPRVRPTSVRC